MLPLVASVLVLAPFDDDSRHVTPSAEVGVEYFHYAEFGQADASGNQPVLDHYSAAVPTARLELEATWPRAHLFARATALLASGDMTYYGGVENLATGAVTQVVGTTSGWMLDLDLVAGARMRVGERVLVGGFAGIGDHGWDRDLRGNQGGYLEQYAWDYAELGARVDLAVAPRLELAAELGALVPFAATLAITHQQNGIDDAHLNLGLGGGARVRVAATYALTTRFALTAIAGFELWRITNSSQAPLIVNGQPVKDANGQQLYLFEPPSTTYRTSLEVGAAYRF